MYIFIYAYFCFLHELDRLPPKKILQQAEITEKKKKGHRQLFVVCWNLIQSLNEKEGAFKLQLMNGGGMCNVSITAQGRVVRSLKSCELKQYVKLNRLNRLIIT